MLEGLDSIPWSQLTHAYGPADDVPGLLRALLSADNDERESALSDLFGNICHQGTVYKATAYAVPFLVDVAVAPAGPGREHVLGLLGAIAESDDGPRGAHDAVVQRAETIAGLLHDPDPLVRAGAAYVLGALAELAPRLAPLLRAAVDREGDALARAGILLGLCPLRDHSAENIAWLEGRFRARVDDREGFAAAAALAHAAREGTPAPVIIFLADACADPDANSSRFEGLCWDMAGETMPREALAAAGKAAREALPIVLEALNDAEDGVDASFLLEDGLAIAFGLESLDRAPATLDEQQTIVLKAVVDAAIIWKHPNLCRSALDSYRLPTSRKELLAFLKKRT